jgi:hypothetical protein
MSPANIFAPVSLLWPSLLRASVQLPQTGEAFCNTTQRSCWASAFTIAKGDDRLPTLAVSDSHSSKGLRSRSYREEGVSLIGIAISVP